MQDVKWAMGNSTDRDGICRPALDGMTADSHNLHHHPSSYMV